MTIRSHKDARGFGVSKPGSASSHPPQADDTQNYRQLFPMEMNGGCLPQSTATSLIRIRPSLFLRDPVSRSAHNLRIAILGNRHQPQKYLFSSAGSPAQARTNNFCTFVPLPPRLLSNVRANSRSCRVHPISRSRRSCNIPQHTSESLPTSPSTTTVIIVKMGKRSRC